MKPSPTGSSPETCRAAGQDEKSCPVCQAWGGVLGPGSGLRSGPGPRPGVVLGSGPGPGAVLGPGSGLVPSPGAAPLPEPESRSVSGPGAGPGARRGSGSGPKPDESTTPAPAAGQKTQAKPGQAPRRKVLVTGGGGYLGFSLGSSLAERGTSVVLLDLRRPQWELPPRTEFTQADVRDEEALYRALEGVDCVFHAASCGMSGAEKLQKEQIESINVGGTKLVIDVCVRRRVPRLVYTSTVNVAFGGKPIEQGDEDSAPYFPLDKHMDHYSRTKAIADQLTLMANGTPLPGGGTLRTCVLRPPGIYGPEEQKHLPRVASYVKKRLFVFRFGDRRARMNWVHVRNLVQAHVLAAEALTAAKGYVASGQAYYINDGDSVNLFEWMAPLVGVGTPAPLTGRIWSPVFGPLTFPASRTVRALTLELPASRSLLASGPLGLLLFCPFICPARDGAQGLAYAKQGMLSKCSALELHPQPACGLLLVIHQPGCGGPERGLKKVPKAQRKVFRPGLLGELWENSGFLP
ncbi:putative short-chain dehydrogenase/reductase family 42E member 2 isoform X1 [Heterocephalus glaber]|uniref:Short-chain dehydrogenase/reductase family 42E member 2 isoform X1 n=1 Tax=Heterocephalus glaber TaxID=10181 RepID=A0AAX6RBI1_HETGA|nr:putative short-chain dehydrogenase/reductase family 42E member 2 isoform X1 [Heterocephalus glaber]